MRWTSVPAIVCNTARKPTYMAITALSCPCRSTRSSACLQQDTVVAIKQGGNELTISNMDDSKYPMVTFGLDPKQVLADIVIPYDIDTVRASHRQSKCAEGESRASHLGQLLLSCLQGELVCCLPVCLPAMSLMSVIHAQDHCCSRADIQMTKDYTNPYQFDIISPS